MINVSKVTKRKNSEMDNESKTPFPQYYKNYPGKIKVCDNETVRESNVTVIGDGNFILGENCRIIGKFNTVYSVNGILQGNFNIVWRKCSVYGYGNTIWANECKVFGDHNYLMGRTCYLNGRKVTLKTTGGGTIDGKGNITANKNTNISRRPNKRKKSSSSSSSPSSPRGSSVTNNDNNKEVNRTTTSNGEYNITTCTPHSKEASKLYKYSTPLSSSKKISMGRVSISILSNKKFNDSCGRKKDVISSSSSSSFPSSSPLSYSSASESEAYSEDSSSILSSMSSEELFDSEINDCQLEWPSDLLKSSQGLNININRNGIVTMNVDGETIDLSPVKDLFGNLGDVARGDDNVIYVDGNPYYDVEKKMYFPVI